jgi:hypothetical protein
MVYLFIYLRCVGGRYQRQALKATRWLHNMRRLLEAVAKGVSTLQMREPIVVQSIDGKNCVPQITSLIQVPTDLPIYLPIFHLAGPSCAVCRICVSAMSHLVSVLFFAVHL